MAHEQRQATRPAPNAYHKWRQVFKVGATYVLGVEVGPNHGARWRPVLADGRTRAPLDAARSRHRTADEVVRALRRPHALSQSLRRILRETNPRTARPITSNGSAELTPLPHLNAASTCMSLSITIVVVRFASTLA